MLVSDLMTTGIASVSPDTPVSAVVRLLAERGISGVPVMDAAGVLLRMVTEGDLMVSEDSAPFLPVLDAQPVSATANFHGMSSSMRLLGQPLTRRVSRSVK